MNDSANAFASGALCGTGLVHSYVNAGKRGVVLDLKSDEGRAAALRLCATADVVLQSMRPGVAKRLGLDPETLLAANPDLLCYDLNGYGTGPTGQSQPGYDPLVQADCGIISMNGHDGDAPSRCAPSVIDLGTGQWVALGIMAAIMSKRMGKPVNRMETALADTAFSLVAYQASEMPIPCSALLSAMGWADRAIHIKRDVVQPLAIMHGVNPLPGHVCQCVPVVNGSEHLSLEAAHLR